jgi:hypothetical protein
MPAIGTARRERTRSVCRDYPSAVSIDRFEPNGQTDWVSDRHNLRPRPPCLLWVNFYKTRGEHNESAVPKKLSVKAEVFDRQGRANHAD